MLQNTPDDFLSKNISFLCFRLKSLKRVQQIPRPNRSIIQEWDGGVVNDEKMMLAEAAGGMETLMERRARSRLTD